ncbi:hypothetical protein H0H87_001192 [Tephrocybe sp. NHM501043]|nr:hypothetical protein H0H87_001192 [Tephrocybe sp. NHM501043]
MIPRLLANSFPRTMRLAVNQPILRTRFQRPLSTTLRVQNIDIPTFSAAFQQTTTFKKLANHPEAINAIRSMMDTLRESGIDVASGTQPSTFKMAKLMMNSKFREQVKRVAEEMNKAGVDLSSKVRMALVQNCPDHVDQ